MRPLDAYDIVSDKSGVLNIGVAWTKMIDTKLALTLRGFAEAEHFKVVDKLDRETVGIQALVRWQNYIGYTAPVYQISLSSQNDHYKVHQRGSDVFTLQASVAKRLTDSITLNYGVEGMLRNSDGSVFDLQQGRVFAGADYQISSQWVIYGNYSLIGGDTFSSAQTQFCNGVM